MNNNISDNLLPEESHEFSSLLDETDVSILMHRDAHFSGLFDSMISYYQGEGRGINPEFELERIMYLAEIERRLGRNLAPLLLSGADAESVAESKRVYKELRDLYEDERTGSLRYPRLIADLILTEDPEAKEEIEAIVKEGSAITPSLIEVLRSTDFHNSLFPGYGKAPEFAMMCLGRIGDKRSIISLFEEIGRGDFFEEDVALKGLKMIGDPAKEFLLKVLKSHPITEDNERAAIALIEFRHEGTVKEQALNLLEESNTRTQVPFANYLVLICEDVVNENDKVRLKAIADDPKTQKMARDEILRIINF